MIDKIVQQLDDPDVNRRKRAIKALAQTKNPEALKYLAAVVKTDTNPEVVELARKAGAYIKKYAEDYDEEPLVSATDRLGGRYDDYEEDTEDEPEAEEIRVSAADEERANGLVQQALDWHMRDDNDKAAQYLVRAFKTNPHLKNDSYTAGLAATVTGLSTPEAVRLLMDEAQAGDKKKKKKEKEKEKRSAPRDDGEITWGDALIDLGIYFFVVAGTIGIAALIGLQFARPLIEEMVYAAANDPAVVAGMPDMATIMNDLMGVGTVAIILYAVLIGATAVVILLIIYAVIHFAATSMLGGDGEYLHLIRKLTLFYTGVSVLEIVLTIIGLYLSLSNPEISNSFSVVMLVFSFIVYFFMAVRIGQNYEFSTGRGCATLVVTWILFFVLGCACSMVLPMLLGSSGVG